ncbi:MAG: ArsR/SmtB family transcription factor [Phycisphaerae bacterium]
MDPEAVFKAMADKTRQYALCLLSREELSVSELVELLRLPQSTVSRHLKVLRETRLIVDRKVGQAVYCSVAPDPVGGNSELSGRLMEWIREQPLSDGLAARLKDVLRRQSESSEDFFVRIGRRWDRLREASFGNCFHLEALWALLPADWTVLDAGTGTGYLLPSLANRFRRIIAVDAVDSMLDAARQRVTDKALTNVHFRRGDLADLPVEPGTIDLALALLVLHHVPHPADAIGSLFRVLKGEGRVLIVEQAAHSNESFRDRMHDRWMGFEPSRLIGLLAGAGFRDIECGRLATVDRGDDAPDLYVVTGRR